MNTLNPKIVKDIKKVEDQQIKLSANEVQTKIKVLIAQTNRIFQIHVEGVY